MSFGTEMTPEQKQIIAALRQAARDLGKRYTIREYGVWARANGAPGVSTVLAVFGKWSEARRTAGLPAGRRGAPAADIPPEKVLDAIRRAARIAGVDVAQLSYRTYLCLQRRYRLPSLPVILRFFPGWKAAKEAASSGQKKD